MVGSISSGDIIFVDVSLGTVLKATRLQKFHMPVSRCAKQEHKDFIDAFKAIQGKDCLIQKFRNSSVMLEPPHCRPKVSSYIKA